MINIAVDGPAGAGKSSISKAVAKKLEFVYVDTGALYRAIGLYAVRNGVDTNDEKAVVALLPNISVDLTYIENIQAVMLNGEDVSGSIRTSEISTAASNVSRFNAVRQFLLDVQKDIAAKKNVIMDGRDIGTVILPNAQVKIFLTASAEVRAKRRYLQDIEAGKDVSLEKIVNEFKERDYNDSHRAIAPLKQAEDAVLLDTSDMSIDEVIEKMTEIITSKVML